MACTYFKFVLYKFLLQELGPRSICKMLCSLGQATHIIAVNQYGSVIMEPAKISMFMLQNSLVYVMGLVELCLVNRAFWGKWCAASLKITLCANHIREGFFSYCHFINQTKYCWRHSNATLGHEHPEWLQWPPIMWNLFCVTKDCPSNHRP